MSSHAHYIKLYMPLQQRGVRINVGCQAPLVLYLGEDFRIRQVKIQPRNPSLSQEVSIDFELAAETLDFMIC